MMQAIPPWQQQQQHLPAPWQHHSGNMPAGPGSHPSGPQPLMMVRPEPTGLVKLESEIEKEEKEVETKIKDSENNLQQQHKVIFYDVCGLAEVLSINSNLDIPYNFCDTYLVPIYL